MKEHLAAHQMFSRIAATFPTEPAVESPSRTVSYRELEMRTDGLALALRNAGVRRDTLVGVIAEDRLRWIESLLGILKAGGVFVPLSPDLPDARLLAMLRRTEPTHLLVESALRERLGRVLPSGFEARICSFDVAAEDPGDWAPPEMDPDALSYVVFTSGSSGEPKGIAGRLKSIGHFVRWEIETFGFEPGIRVSQITLPSFDSYLRDIFVPLCAGGTVCVPEMSATELDIPRLARWLSQSGVAVLHGVPSLLRALLNTGLEAGDLPHLTHILMAGEPLLPADVARCREIFADRVRLVNLYGPSETTMTKFSYVVSAGDSERPSIPIGKPIRGAAAIVVDSQDRPCPPGTAGEILIRTPYRALGYFRDSERTDKVFIPNPFSQDPQDIVYRTGDLGRVLPDGNFEFLGRLDRQVKIRGVRIELAEIESLLLEHPAVQDVAAVDLSHRDGTRYLCAYVVVGDDLEEPRLRQYLGERLPIYMTPSAIVLIESLPRTPNGKIDRGALPKPAELRVESAYVAPRSPVQEVLAALWAELLEVERPGLEDNFFQLGGHSLLATLILARIRDTFQVEVSLRRFFDLPTLGGLAQQVEAELCLGPTNSEVPQLRRAPRHAQPPLSFAQERQWFLEQLNPASAYYNIVSTVRVEGALRPAVLQAALTEVIHRHEVLRARFSSEDGQPAQEIRPQCEVVLWHLDLSALGRERVEAESRQVCRTIAHRGFDLASDSLLRTALIRTQRNQWLVLLTMHNIITDGWSRTVLIRELGSLYEDIARARPSTLPELPVQYADYAVWQRRWLSGKTLEEHLAYWEQRFGKAPPPLQLPTKRAGYAQIAGKSGHYRFNLTKELTARLTALSRESSATLFMTLLAAFNVLLYRHCGQQDIVVGLPIAGRSRPELENLIGTFINFLPIRADLSGNPSFKTLLREVRSALIGAYAHQELPFAKLVEALRDGEATSETPLFEVQFNFQNFPVESLKVSDLEFIPFDYETGFARYPLVLYMWPDGEALSGAFVYTRDAWEEKVIRRWGKSFSSLLENIVQEPDCRIDEVKLMKSEDQVESVAKQRSRSTFKKYQSKRRQSIALSGGEFVKMRPLWPDEPLPLLVEPEIEGVNLVGWMGANRDKVELRLREHGGLLFRGFDIDSVDKFFEFAGQVIDRFVNYVEGSSPRVAVSDKVYTSTEYPSDQSISMHNELSYAHKWPCKIIFYCETPAERGGETPIVDSRKVLKHLPGDVRQRFLDKGIRYVRNLHGKAGAGLSWQSVFETEDKSRVEEYCREGKIDFRWKAGGELWTSQVRPAAICHPVTGDELWFNQAHQFHPSDIDKNAYEALIAVVSEEELPINAQYGDGSPIAVEDLDAIRKVYEDTRVMFPWMKGDVMLLDNMQVAHGRMPFVGERRVVVSMGDSFRLTNIGGGEGLQKVEIDQ